MKQFLLILFFAATFIACNSNNEKPGTTGKTNPTDTSTVSDMTVPENVITGDTSLPVAANRLIVPGKSIGLTSIGQENAETLTHLGPPALQDAGMGKELATWYSIKGKDTANQMNIFFMTNMGEENEAGRVAYIRITSSFFSTSQHIGTGSGFDSIKKHFPGIKKVAVYTSPQTNTAVTIYEDEKAGISFEVDNKTVCKGITIQKPGEFANEIYISLFPDIVFPRKAVSADQ